MRKILTLIATLAIAIIGVAAPAAATDDKDPSPDKTVLVEEVCDGTANVAVYAGDTNRNWRVDGGEPQWAEPYETIHFTAESVDAGVEWWHEDSLAWTVAPEIDEEGGYVQRIAAEGCPVLAESGEPTTTDQTCDEPGTITIPDSEGVLWVIDNEPVEPGTSAAAPGEYVVVASPDEGFYFAGEEAITWTVEVAPVVEACPGPPGPQGDPGADGKPGVTVVDDVEPTSSTKALPKTGATTTYALMAAVLIALGAGMLLAGKRRVARARR